MFVYLLRNTVNGKGYVGQTSLPSVDERFKAHLRASKSDWKRKRLPIAAAIHKHGWDSFERSLLEVCASQEGLDLAELRWIAQLGTVSPGGYNVRAGGRGGGRNSEASKLKQRAKMSGRILTPEHRRKIADACRGTVHSPKRNKKISNALRGRKNTWSKGRPGITMRADLCADFVRRGHEAQAKLRASGELDTRAENNANAKLGWTEVRAMRALWATGEHSQQSLADLFGVTQTNVGRIVRGVSWKESKPVATSPDLRTTDGKLTFVRGLIQNITNDVLAYISEGKAPEEWDGHELRCLVADLAEDSAKISRVRRDKRDPRSKAYRNHMLVTPKH